MISSISHTLRFGSSQPAASSSAERVFSKKPLKNAYLKANDTYQRLAREDEHLKTQDEVGRTIVTPRVGEALRLTKAAERQYRQSDENKTIPAKLVGKLVNLVTKK